MCPGQRLAVSSLARRGWVLALLLGVAGMVSSGELTGVPEVMDGDTLVLGGMTSQLAGVHAPSIEQTRFSPQEWACGDQAALALEQLVDGQVIRCTVAEAGETTTAAACSLDVLEVNGWVVREGWGLAAEEAALYVPLQHQAAEAERGMWLGGFKPTPAWIAWASGKLKPGDFDCSVCAARKQRLKEKP